jgi:hypothetical protein
MTEQSGQPADWERDRDEWVRLATRITLADLRRLPESELVYRHDWLMMHRGLEPVDRSYIMVPDDYLRELERHTPSTSG